MSETNENAGERTNGDTRSMYTNRICLPSTADEDDVAVPQIERVIARLKFRGPQKAPAFWGEDERRHEVKAYLPDMPTEYSR